MLFIDDYVFYFRARSGGVYILYVSFFFSSRRRHTRSLCDWSSDVCSSDLSRAPLAKLQAYKRRMGWTFPWASSFGGDFNFDYSVGITEEQQREGGVEYNYRSEERRVGKEWRSRREVDASREGV